MSARRRLLPIALPLLLGACSYQRYQSALGGAGVEDRQFLTLFEIFLGVCGVMYVLVIGFMLFGIARRGRPGEANVVESGRHHRSDPLMRPTLVGWASLIGIGLVLAALVI
jgi:hypothetical protein